MVEVIRLAGLVLAWWLTATTVLYILARLTSVPTLVRSVEWATFAPVRRVVDGVLATTIVAGATFGSAAMASAEPRSPSPVVVQLDRGANQSEAPAPIYRPRPAGDGVVALPSEEPKVTTTTTVPPAEHRPQSASLSTSPPSRAAPEAPPPPTTYLVQPGDNLWRIAEHQLAAVTGRSPADIGVAEVRAYWLRLVETNRNRLRSGNPDLIHPGEVLGLPEPTDPNPTG